MRRRPLAPVSTVQPHLRPNRGSDARPLVRDEVGHVAQMSRPQVVGRVSGDAEQIEP